MKQKGERIDSPITVTQAVPYQVVRLEDISSRRRKRARAFIYSSAASVEARIQTSMMAAVELQQTTKAKCISVFHLILPDQNLIGTSRYYADLSYAPDGLGVSGESPLRNGTWEAWVADEIVDSSTLKVESLWWSNRDRFQRDYGLGVPETDEKALKEFVARQMGISPEAVKLAILTLRPYP